MKLLLVLGVAALLYILERQLYSRFFSQVSMDVTFREDALFEGEEGVLTEVLENRSFLPLPFLHAKFRVGIGVRFDAMEANVSTSDKRYKNDIYSMLFYQRIRRELPFLAAKRGYYPIDEADITGADLFFTTQMVGRIPVDTSLYVYPKQMALGNLEDPLMKLMGDVQRRNPIYQDPFAFRGIRDYTPQDPMNTINWKASARTNSFMVNQFDATTTRKIVILLNLEDDAIVRHPLLHEESLRIVCTVAERFLSEGYSVDFICNGRDSISGENVEPMTLDSGSEEIRFLRVLARLSVDDFVSPFVDNLEVILRDSEVLDRGFVVISPAVREDLAEAFTLLYRQAPSLWIAPLHPTMQVQFGTESTDHSVSGSSTNSNHLFVSSSHGLDAHFIRWEVSEYA